MNNPTTPIRYFAAGMAAATAIVLILSLASLTIGCNDPCDPDEKFSACEDGDVWMCDIDHQWSKALDCSDYSEDLGITMVCCEVDGLPMCEDKKYCDE